MSLVRALCRCACGGLGMLLLAGASFPAAETITGSDGASPAPANPAATSPAVGSPAESSSPAATTPADNADKCDQACMDDYLWSLYERTPKIDTVSVPERTKVTVKRKGKTRTVTRTVSKLVDEDFAWKDPKAAELAGMSLKDYVIGGMDPAFRVTLYHALRILDDAGFKPGITCAFRDDYRQSIATGLKARNDRSYHGGSLRGGYGHGVAADIVSVKGDTRTEQLASSAQMWDFIDGHEQELGIGRPYLDRDPPHVGPIDGEEYADHRLLPKIEHAEAAARKHHAKSQEKSRKLASRHDQSATKREAVPHPSRAQYKQRPPAI